MPAVIALMMASTVTGSLLKATVLTSSVATYFETASLGGDGGGGDGGADGGGSGAFPGAKGGMGGGGGKRALLSPLLHAGAGGGGASNASSGKSRTARQESAVRLLSTSILRHVCTPTTFRLAMKVARSSSHRW